MSPIGRYGSPVTVVDLDADPAGHLLSGLARLVDGEVRGDTVVGSVTVDSRGVADRSLFAAIPGSHRDGHAYALAAVRAGAVALLVQRWLPVPVPQLRVPLVRRAVGPLSAAVYGYPGDALTLVGITGTNGKTTTAHLSRAGLQSAGRCTGLIGTVENRFNGWAESATLTTPDAPRLQAMLARMRHEGADSVVMEVSSQGLDQYRVDGLEFSLAVWLNLGSDHLDYHGTVEQYYAAKARLFEPGLARRGLVCVDDRWGQRLAAQAAIDVVTFGRHPAAEVRVQVLRTGLAGTEIRLTGLTGLAAQPPRVADDRWTTPTTGGSSTADEVVLRAPVVGEANASNIAAAYLAGRLLGACPARLADGIAHAEPIPGRFQRVDAGQPFLVIVDYAHTPDAYSGLISTGRSLTGPGGQVHLVVGCRGDKDRFKRPLTGRVATGADRVVLTTDSPGNEDPLAILQQVLTGTLDVPHRHVRVEPDRRAAIRSAIGQAGAGDVVLVVGRGHERTRLIGDLREEFDDRQVAADALAASGYRDPDRDRYVVGGGPARAVAQR